MTSLKIISSILIIVIIYGCADEKVPTQQDIVKQNIEAHLQDALDDPDSYEFIKLELIDSVTYANNVEYRKDYFEGNMERDEEWLQRKRGYKNEIPSMYDEKEVKELEGEIKRNEKIISAIDSLANGLGDDINKVASYTYTFAFRNTNAFGAKVRNDYYIQTDPGPDYSIKNFTDDKDDLFLNPNDFPGYRETILKY